MPDGASLNRLWPFKIPPEGGKVAVAPSCVEAGVAAFNTNGHAWDETRSGARLGDVILQECVFNEAEVVHGDAVNAYLKPAVMGGACIVARMEVALHVASRGDRSRLDILEFTMKGLADADEMSMVHVQC